VSTSRPPAAATPRDAITVDAALLRAWPLPQPDPAGDKEERGHVLVIAGSVETPGAAWLAGVASLRVGAGRLAVATAARAAAGLAIALPEARVVALPETGAGGLATDGVASLHPVLGKVAAVLVGPGLQDEAASVAFVDALLPHVGEAALVLDAYAMGAATNALHLDRAAAAARTRGTRPGTPVLTPHAGEMAHLTGRSKADVLRDPADTACAAAARWSAIVVLKGARTHIAAPDGRLWIHEGSGNAGLATSGSGDVLAGLLVGLAARGAPPEQAAAWAVALHSRAGAALAARHGPLGYLAREIPAEVPGLLRGLVPG
jgi:hydroxyethylthiazole kinase-like uncharacterized protein yjeF